MLYMRPHTDLRRFKIRSFYVGTCCPETAVIILIRRHRPAVTEKAGFFQRLGKGHIGAYAFAATFFVIIRHKFFRRYGDIRVGIYSQQIFYALFFACQSRADNGKITGGKCRLNGGVAFGTRIMFRLRVQDGLYALTKRRTLHISRRKIIVYRRRLRRIVYTRRRRSRKRCRKQQTCRCQRKHNFFLLRKICFNH